MPRQTDIAFVKRIGHALCAKADHTSITGTVKHKITKVAFLLKIIRFSISGESPTVVTVWIEYEVLRDVSFLFKWYLFICLFFRCWQYILIYRRAMAPSNRVFPAPHASLNGYSPHSVIYISYFTWLFDSFWRILCKTDETEMGDSKWPSKLTKVIIFIRKQIFKKIRNSCECCVPIWIWFVWNLVFSF